MATTKSTKAAKVATPAVIPAPTIPQPRILASVRCAVCGYEGPPKRWIPRIVIGIINTIFWVLPGLIFFSATNPYKCSKCGNRHALTKIYSDGTETVVRAMKKQNFLAIWIGIYLVAFSILVINSASTTTNQNGTAMNGKSPQASPVLTNQQLFKIGNQATGLFLGLQYENFVGLGEPNLFLASGVLITNNGIVATNYHVIKNVDLNDLVFQDSVGERHKIEKILAVSPLHDLAIVQISDASSSFISIGDSDKVAIGDDVFAVGNPEGFINSFSTGVVGGIRGDQDCSPEYVGNCLQISAAISHGSSGGALLNKSGELIGVTFASYTSAQNINFAIPSSYILELISKGGAPTTYAKSEPDSLTLRCQAIVKNLQKIYTNVDDFEVSYGRKECAIILSVGASTTSETATFAPEKYFYNRRTGDRYIIMENDLSNVVFVPAWQD